MKELLFPSENLKKNSMRVLDNSFKKQIILRMY